ncbi:MAG: bifunctional UDP-N-acetylglucosamine diphosphorylase/glucosamine-1-phosphate N-acetyltransferase GlmU [Fluviibacter sp.]
MQVVILAAGQGTRMRSGLPKVLHPIAGQAMVKHVIAAAATLQPQKTVAVVGHGAPVVEGALAEAGVSFALQSPQLGTGHAVQMALPELQPLPENGQVLILYGDVPLIQPATLKALLQAAGDGVGLITQRLDNPTGYGRIVRDAAGKVVCNVEEKDATDEQRRITEVNTGILCLPAQRLASWLGALSNQNAQGEYYLTDLLAMAVQQGVPVHTVSPGHDWEVAGVNSKAQLAALERAWQLHQAEGLLEAGVRLADPARVDIRGSLTCGRDVSIDVGCVFEGDVVLEEGVQIGPYCVIRNVTVGAGARIDAFSHLDHAEVGPDAVVGPYARLRPGSALGAGAHVGNFVELKNTQLGAGSKANHLAYVGDATVGDRVNIGAGTITCNYDGANKFRTIIEDDAFIGSDTQLVAPVTVGRGATLGAGTTLTKDAPADTLTVSRAKQLSLPGWQRPVKQKK